MDDDRDCGALAGNVGRFLVLPASVCDIADLGVEDEKMSKQELAHIAKVMLDLQRYCVWQVYNEHPNYCGYCPLWSYKDNECSLFMLYNGEYQKNCTGKYPCKWHITEADIERQERDES
jgi:hypothetical protein